jgi:hypothetical protein
MKEGSQISKRTLISILRQRNRNLTKDIKKTAKHKYKRPNNKRKVSSRQLLKNLSKTRIENWNKLLINLQMRTISTKKILRRNMRIEQKKKRLPGKTKGNGFVGISLSLRIRLLCFRSIPEEPKNKKITLRTSF